MFIIVVGSQRGVYTASSSPVMPLQTGGLEICYGIGFCGACISFRIAVCAGTENIVSAICQILDSSEGVKISVERDSYFIDVDLRMTTHISPFPIELSKNKKYDPMKIYLVAIYRYLRYIIT